MSRSQARSASLLPGLSELPNRHTSDYSNVFLMCGAMAADVQNGDEVLEPRPQAQARAIARLAAVQALYQMDLTQRDLNEVVAEFIAHRFANEALDLYRGADQAFFEDIVSGVVKKQSEIDAEIASKLAEGWRLSRIDRILRAGLRAGVYELLFRTDVPARVTINEYVEVARAFFGGEEPAVVNGLLDKVARSRRKSEFFQKDGPKAGG